MHAAIHSTLAPTLAEGGALDYFGRLWLREDASSVNGYKTDDLYMWIWWFCVLWFVFLMTLMFYFTVKYKRRKGHIAPRSASHNTPLEIAWTVIPTLFLVYLFFQGFWTYIDKLVAPASAMEISLVGQKWNWSLVYPNGSESSASTIIGARSIPVFYLPAEKPIKVRLNSSDVMHGFFIPDFRVKQDLLPNRYTTAWFEAKAPRGKLLHPSSIAEVETAKASAAAAGGHYAGADYIKELAGVPYEDHWLFCSSYCGDEHSEMAAIIRIVPDDAFNAWLGTIGDDLPPVELGAKIYKIKGCNQCHTLDASAGTGPTWKNMYGHPVAFTDGSSYTAEQMTGTEFDNYVRESITQPGMKIVALFGPQMPVTGLNDKQIDGVIADIKSLSDKAPPPAAAAPAGAAGTPGTGAPGAASPEAPSNPAKPNPPQSPGAPTGQPGTEKKP